MLPPFVFLSVALQLLCAVAQHQSFFDAPYQSNSIDCQNDQMCTFIENCPAIVDLMSQGLLPIHRFRQALCGYDNIKVKVCCDLDNGPANPGDGSLSRRSNSIMECGKSYVDSDFNALGVYPFVARIGFLSVTGETRYPCSGVILNERTILTTASCALTKTDHYKLHSVLVGEFNAETDPDCSARKHNISYVIKHPYYDEKTFANNIAMLRLREPIQYTETVQPICLPPPDMQIGPGGGSVLVGWGKLSSQKIKLCQQQCLRMRIAPAQECSNYYAHGYSVELCAIGDEMPCSGYNGSPLLFKYGNTYFLLGILSHGSNCNSTTNYPTVFVDVQRYIRWIIENC
ncbi:phenoloxidase-activating factor 1 [Nomia melanderi]|uniref:phenoloxidase-activating factor 1 n=1 Tax=Nomia melanderi TaxID=2448451 RepID=UPI0013047AC4|nr:phenoloxidase-activating factor 1-like [Nomia melanderi]